ncbi:MAG: hypothetical protein ACTSU5_12660 [Promethearchaeota archaeon]
MISQKFPGNLTERDVLIPGFSNPVFFLLDGYLCPKEAEEYEFLPGHKSSAFRVQPIRDETFLQLVPLLHSFRKRGRDLSSVTDIVRFYYPLLVVPCDEFVLVSDSMDHFNKPVLLFRFSLKTVGEIKKAFDELKRREKLRDKLAYLATLTLTKFIQNREKIIPNVLSAKCQKTFKSLLPASQLVLYRDKHFFFNYLNLVQYPSKTTYDKKIPRRVKKSRVETLQAAGLLESLKEQYDAIEDQYRTQFQKQHDEFTRKLAEERGKFNSNISMVQDNLRRLRESVRNNENLISAQQRNISTSRENINRLDREIREKRDLIRQLSNQRDEVRRQPVSNYRSQNTIRQLDERIRRLEADVRGAQSSRGQQNRNIDTANKNLNRINHEIDRGRSLARETEGELSRLRGKLDELEKLAAKEQAKHDEIMGKLNSISENTSRDYKRLKGMIDKNLGVLSDILIRMPPVPTSILKEMDLPGILFLPVYLFYDRRKVTAGNAIDGHVAESVTLLRGEGADVTFDPDMTKCLTKIASDAFNSLPEKSREHLVKAFEEKNLLDRGALRITLARFSKYGSKSKFKSELEGLRGLLAP